MDANIHVEKSEVLQAMKQVGWKDISSCLGDTFRKGFKELKAEGTTVWNRLGEEKFGENLAKANTKVQKDRVHKLGPQWTIIDLIEAGYADTIQEKQITN